MTNTFNEVGWATSDVKLGDNEICPGLSLTDHAESVTMWDLHSMPANNKAWELAVKICTNLTVNKLMNRDVNQK